LPDEREREREGLTDEREKGIALCIFLVGQLLQVVNSLSTINVWGARGTVQIEARTTAQAREAPHSYPKP